MKTDKISFGQTYIKPSLAKYMKEENIQKMPYIFGFGEFYPTDIFIGANKKGELTLDIVHSTLAKQIFFNEDIPKTLENVTVLNFLHNMERLQRLYQGVKTPVSNVVIKDIENLSVKDLQLAVNDKIQQYYETLAKKFLN